MTSEEEIARLRADLLAAQGQIAALRTRKALNELILEHRQMSRTPGLMMARRLRGWCERGLAAHLRRSGFPETRLEDVLSWELDHEPIPPAVLDHLSLFLRWPRAGLLRFYDGPPLRLEDTSLDIKGLGLDIGCDGPHEQPEDTVERFLSESAAREAGWTLGNGWDLCPDCTRKGVKPPEGASA